MGVMTTGMHDAYLLTVIRAFDLARKRNGCAFCYRQAIHVGAEPDHRSGQSTLEYPYHARLPHPFLYFDTQATEMIRDDLCRPRLMIAQLRVFVKIPSPCDRLRLH